MASVSGNSRGSAATSGARSVPATPEKRELSSRAGLAAEEAAAVTARAPSTVPPAAAKHRKEAAIHRGFGILLRRFFTLSAMKFELLCRSSNRSQALLNQMWYAFVHIVAERRDLLQDHAGTHLVLCTYAGILRTNNITADLQSAATTLLRNPADVCTGIPLTTSLTPLPQPPAERKVGTIQDYYNIVFVRPASKILFKAKALFEEKEEEEDEDGNEEGGQQQEAKKGQHASPPTILLPPQQKHSRLRRASLSSLTPPQKLKFQLASPPSSSSSSSFFFPQSPSRLMPLYTEMKAPPAKRALTAAAAAASGTLFPQRTLNFDDVGCGSGGNDDADDEKSESDLEKDKKERCIPQELVCDN